MSTRYTPKSLVILATVTLTLALVTPSAAFETEEQTPERLAEQAKAAYLADPSPQTMAALDAAVRTLRDEPAEPGTKQQPALPIRALLGESEPNDDAGSADPLAQGESGGGDLSPAADVDWWAYTSAAVDDLVFTYVDTAGSSSSADSQLNVFADDGTTLIEADDDDGPGMSSCVAGAIVPQAGGVYYRINEFADDQELGPYGLFQLVSSMSSNEVESNDTCGTANPVQWVTNASLPGGDTQDWFSFSADLDDSIVVIMDDDPNDDNNAFDSTLAIIDSDCSSVLATGDDGSAGHGNCAGAAVAPATATYYVRVSDGGFGDGDTDYRFVVLVNGEPVVPVTLQSFSIE